VFEAAWSIDWRGLVTILVGTAALTALGGVIAAFAALSHTPASRLRAD